jgi:hypothetical protein
MIPYEEKLIADVVSNLPNLSTAQIAIWKEHVLANPYNIGEISKEIVRLLTEELERRKADE